MHSVRHIFFDLDRTLWDFETNSQNTLRELFDELDLAEQLGVASTTFIKEYKRINEIYWNDYRDGVITKEELRHARFEATMQYFGHDDPGLAARFGELYIERSPHRTALVDGAIELLDHLSPNYALHIITNGFSEVQHIKMSESGLAPYFRQVIISEEVGYKKPHRKVFRFAENATGSVPGNSLMIGDHFEADITGALNAGWKAVFFEPDGMGTKKRDGFVQVSSLPEIMRLL